MIANKFPGLYRLWANQNRPLVVVDDEDTRQRIASQASLLLIGALMLLAIIPFTYFAGVPGTTFTTRVIADVSCIIMFLVGRGLSRRNHLQLAVFWMIFPASVIIVAISIVNGTYGYLTLFFLAIPIVISGLFAAPKITISLVVFDTVLVLFCNIALGLFDADVLISPIIFNIVLAFFVVTTVENRNRQIARFNLRLQQSEARYRALVESVKDVLFTLSPDGTITTVNAAVTSITGFEIEELTGKHFLSVFHPDDYERVKNTFGKVMQGEKPNRIEARALTKTGDSRWIELSASAIEVEGLHGMSGVARDISARKLTEAALQESRQRLSLFIEQMPLALIEWDTHQNIIAWNPAAGHIFGYAEAEATQLRGFEFLVAEADKPHFKELLTDVFEHKVVRLWTTENVTKDGRTIICEWVNIPLVDEAGTVLGVAAMAEDVTERVSSQQHQMKLMLTQERLNVLQHFLSSISHDFRTSLTQIETNRYLIGRATLPGEKGKIQPRLDNISVSIQHLVTQLENLNMISSLGQLRLHPYNINLMLDQLVQSRQSAAATKNIKIQKLFAGDLPSVNIDGDKLQTAITHLLTNAITYTPPGQSITVETEKNDNLILVHVSDTGQGIDEKDKDQIFDLFYRADQARSLNTGGIGVGLSIARLIAEAHGGTLSVASEQGQGSKFTLTIPIVPESKLALELQ